MRIDPCYFCSRPTYPSKGISFVRNDGRALRFCRSKCHKNFKLRRNPRRLKWTKASRMQAGKEMTCDTTLLFGARRNVPQRYDRELVNKTLDAIRHISEIRARRERAFYKKRMVGKRAREIAQARKLVAENEHLLPRLRGSELRRLAAESAKDTNTEMEIEEGDMIQTDSITPKSKSRVFGGEQRRLKVTVDGNIEPSLE